MPIQARSADGKIHQFPDGTDRSVIDRVMKDYAMRARTDGGGAQKPWERYQQQEAPSPGGWRVRKPDDDMIRATATRVDPGAPPASDPAAAAGWRITRRANGQPSEAARGWRITKRADGRPIGTTNMEAARASRDEALRNGPSPEPSYGLGLAANLGHGLTAGFGDELGGGLLAGTVGEMNAYSMLNGDPSAQLNGDVAQVYADGRDAIRKTQKDFADSHPIAATIGQIAGAIPTMLAAPVARAPTMLGRMVRGAGIGGAYGAVEGYGSGEGGAGNRALNATVGLGLGASLGGLLEAVVPRFVAMFKSNRAPSQVVDQSGNLTPDGQRILRDAGIDPGMATPEFVKELQRRVAQEVGRAGDVGAAGTREALAQTLPVPVPLTRGQKTLDPQHQGFEWDARSGNFGPDVTGVVRGFDERTQAALMQNIEEIQRRIAGGADPIPYRGAGGEMVSARLSAMRAEEQRHATGLYKRAEKLTPPTALQNRPFGDPETAIVPRNEGANMRRPAARRFAATLWDDTIRAVPLPENAPGVFAAVTRLGRLADADTVPIADVFQIRKVLGNLQRSGGAESVAATAAKRSLDDGINDMLERQMLSGDQEAIKAWGDAISNYREFSQRWNGDDMLAGLTQRVRGGDELVKSPEEAANFILGSSDLSFISRPQLARSLYKLRTRLGETSREWNAIREEVFIRIADRAQGPRSATGRDLSGAKFEGAIESFATKNPALWRMLFSAEEQTVIKQLGRVMSYATNPVVGARNPPNTGAAFVRALKLASNTPVLSNFLSWAARNFENIAALGEAQKATSGRLAPAASSPAGRPAVALGIGAQQNSHPLLEFRGR